MATTSKSPRRRSLAYCALALITLACGSDGDGGNTPEPPQGPFKSLERASNAPAVFTNPRAGVPLASGATAFIATVLATEDTPAHLGVFMQQPGKEAPPP